MKHKKFKNAKDAKFYLIGSGIAFCLGAIWTASISSSSAFFLTYIFFTLGHTFINIMRGLSIYKICKKCDFKGDWHKCPGMGEILHPK